MGLSKVDVALMLDGLSTDYLVEFSPGEALEFVRRAEAYNEFTAQDLEKLVEQVNRLIPPMRFPNPENPNNGLPHHRFKIGNEGSRVIYLIIRKFYLKPEFQGRRIDYAELARQLENLGREAHASECHVVVDDEYEFTYRFWWD
jgi:hypothetical protein